MGVFDDDGSDDDDAVLAYCDSVEQTRKMCAASAQAPPSHGTAFPQARPPPLAVIAPFCAWNMDQPVFRHPSREFARIWRSAERRVAVPTGPGSAPSPGAPLSTQCRKAAPHSAALWLAHAPEHMRSGYGATAPTFVAFGKQRSRRRTRGGRVGCRVHSSAGPSDTVAGAPGRQATVRRARPHTSQRGAARLAKRPRLRATLCTTGAWLATPTGSVRGSAGHAQRRCRGLQGSTVHRERRQLSGSRAAA